MAAKGKVNLHGDAQQFLSDQRIVVVDDNLNADRLPYITIHEKLRVQFLKAGLVVGTQDESFKTEAQRFRYVVANRPSAPTALIMFVDESTANGYAIVGTYELLDFGRTRPIVFGIFYVPSMPATKAWFFVCESICSPDSGPNLGRYFPVMHVIPVFYGTPVLRAMAAEMKAKRDECAPKLAEVRARYLEAYAKLPKPSDLDQLSRFHAGLDSGLGTVFGSEKIHDLTADLIFGDRDYAWLVANCDYLDKCIACALVYEENKKQLVEAEQKRNDAPAEAAAALAPTDVAPVATADVAPVAATTAEVAAPASTASVLADIVRQLSELCARLNE
jgi:hypothetical protein